MPFSQTRDSLPVSVLTEMHVIIPYMLSPVALIKCQLFDVKSSLSTLQEDFSSVKLNSLTLATFPLLVAKEFMPTKQLHVLEVPFPLMFLAQKLDSRLSS